MLHPRSSSIVSCSRTIPEEDDMKTETRQPRINTLRVDDVMHRGVFTCEREARLSEVAATMAREHVHCVVVESDSGEAGPLWGIVSDLDLVAAATVRDLDDQSAGGVGRGARCDRVARRDARTRRAVDDRAQHGASDRRRPSQRPIGVLSTHRHRSRPRGPFGWSEYGGLGNFASPATRRTAVVSRSLGRRPCGWQGRPWSASIRLDNRCKEATMKISELMTEKVLTIGPRRRSRTSHGSSSRTGSPACPSATSRATCSA